MRGAGRARRRRRRAAGLPLDIAQVLDEEYRALYESDGSVAPAPPLPRWGLREQDLVAPDRLVAHLRGTSQIARFFRQRLPEETGRALASGEPVSAADIVDGLNRLLEAPGLLYDETTLPDLRLDHDLRALTAGALAGDGLVHVNRRLLERAFPVDIKRAYDVRLRAIYERIHAHGK
ncbi:MAG TPA: hypothetical protein VF136_16845, partial [Methylomirabilota bacterium]